jgi:diacylglycerol O-acyltransferase / wax synthase
VIDFFSAKASLVLTNVPGPRDRIQIAGAPVGGVLVWAPCAGAVSMSVSIFSYAGDVSVGFLVDAGLVPDPDALAAHFGEELTALEEAT